MANLSSTDDDSAQTEPIDPELPQPAVHGQIHVGSANTNPDVVAPQMRDHLAFHENHMRQMQRYNGHGGHGQAAEADSNVADVDPDRNRSVED